MEKRIKQLLIATIISIILLTPIFSGAQQIKDSENEFELNKQSVETQWTPSFRQNLLTLKNLVLNKISKNTYDYNITNFLDFLITDDQEYVICGQSGNMGCVRSFLIKTDSSGNEIWNKRYDSLGEIGFFSLDQTNDDGYVICGVKNNYSNNKQEIIVIKTDKDGNKQWLKSYIKSKYMVSTSILTTSENEFIILGTQGESYENRQPFLIKTDEYGSIIWEKTFDINISYISFYGKIIELNNGGFILSGVEKKGNNFELILLKINDNGDEIWRENYHILDYTIAFDFEETSEGNLIVVGYTLNQNQTPSFYMFIMKTDEFGKENWIKIYADNAALSVEETEDKGFIISGLTFDENQGAFLKKIDNNGNQEWINYYPEISSFFFWHMKQTIDSGIIICGYCTEPENLGILVRTDNEGELEWYKTYDYSDVENSYATFYGWDLGNSAYTINIKACNHDMTWSSGSPLGYYNSRKITTCPGTHYYNITWYGKEGSDTITGTFTLEADEHKSIINNLTFCDDLPQIDIIKPVNGIYTFNNKILPFFSPIVIGPIDVTAEVYDNSSEIDYVEYYVDDVYVTNDYTEPYVLPIKLPFLRKSNVKIKAFDTWGYNASKEISVWSI